jgi:hypothetical protein
MDQPGQRTEVFTFYPGGPHILSDGTSALCPLSLLNNYPSTYNSPEPSLRCSLSREIQLHSKFIEWSQLAVIVMPLRGMPQETISNNTA